MVAQQEALLTHTRSSVQGLQLLLHQYHSPCVLAAISVKKNSRFIGVGSTSRTDTQTKAGLCQFLKVLGVSLGRRHAFVVMLAPLTSAVQIVSRQRVCPRLALSYCISCKANRKLRLLPASLVSTLAVWNSRLPKLAPHPTLSQHAVTLQFTFGGRERGFRILLSGFSFLSVGGVCSLPVCLGFFFLQWRLI